MPAQRLSTTPLPAHPLQVIGTYRHADDGYVRHVGLLSADSDSQHSGYELTLGDRRVPLDHVRVRGSNNAAFEGALFRNDTVHGLPAHVVGWLSRNGEQGFTAEDREKLDSFVAQTSLVTSFQYLCDPPFEVQLDPTNPERWVTRMSCVGFVLLVYELLYDKVILAEPNPNYPKFSRSQFEKIYPEIKNFSGSELLGLGFDPRAKEWQVIVPGYVLHALRDGHFPFQPTSTKQARFPECPSTQEHSRKRWWREIGHRIFKHFRFFSRSKKRPISRELH